MTEQTPLSKIPGVGKNMAEHLQGIGITCVEQLKGADPEQLYVQDCARQGVTLDRCVLFVYRCAVYYASNESHEPDKLKWWNWKDE